MSDMSGGFDTTRAARGVDDLEQLVQFVLGTHGANESDWIEWKTDVDLSTKAGSFSAARQILGFANRSPDVAAAHVGGLAYLVVGAEPKNLAGSRSIDPAHLTDGLKRYLGTDGPRWSPVWLSLEGKDVLVVVIEAPKLGDDIHTLRREFEGAQNGAIFIRRPGICEQAKIGRASCRERG